MYDNDYGRLPGIVESSTDHRPWWWMCYLLPYASAQTEVFACPGTPKDRIWWFDANNFKKGVSYAMSYPLLMQGGVVEIGPPRVWKSGKLDGPFKLYGGSTIGFVSEESPGMIPLAAEFKYGNLYGPANYNYWNPASPNYSVLNNHKAGQGQNFLYCDGHVEPKTNPNPEDVLGVTSYTIDWSTMF